MIAEVFATVENGELKLEGALPFPDQTRVKLRIEPLWDAKAAQRNWLTLLARFDQHPIVGAGGPYMREDLYERD